MIRLAGEQVYLRALEPEDLDFLYQLENNPEIWEISGTLVPYSRMLLEQYLRSAHKDIYEVKQLRLGIENKEGLIGLIDLFDFEPYHRRAGIGIVIADSTNRGKGYGTEALQLLCAYCFNVLGLHQVYAGVGEQNISSIELFRKSGFEEAGIKRDWNRRGTGFENEIIFQKINKEDA